MEGQLTIINLNECDKDLVKDREALGRFGKDLCKIINMIPYGEPIINRFGKGDLEGYSMVQFIETSSITVHLDEFENKVFIDIFSCKYFDPDKAQDFSREYFKANKCEYQTIFRK